MNAIIVATPLLAAIWLAPSAAGAQDPPPKSSPVHGAPRTAVPRPSEAPVRAEKPAKVVDSPPAAAGDQGQRGRGGNGGRDADRGRDNGRGRDTGRDAPRPGPRVAVPRPPDVPIRGSSYTRRYYPPAYYDRWVRQTYRWSPLAYAPWSLIYGSAGYSNYGYYSYGGYGPSYGYGNGYGYGQGSWLPWGRSTSYDTGGIRLRVRPRDAQVFVNGYYAGLVDDFDGNFQELRLEQGGHQIEIRMPGFEALQLDVHVQPNRTITIREDLRPRP